MAAILLSRQGHLMRIGGARRAPPPSQTGRAVLPHPAFRSAVVVGLAQAMVPRLWEGTRQPPSLCRPAPPVMGGPLLTGGLQPGGLPPRQHAQPCGPMSALAGWSPSGSQHCLPTSLRSTIITRFGATTDALTPAGPFVTSRGSLIHVARTSGPSLSNHLRTSTSRAPLPLRWQRDCVVGFAVAMPARQFRRPNRVHFVPRAGNRCYGRLVPFQLLSTRGYGPEAVTCHCWPFSVGQVRDFHPAVQTRSQAHMARRFNAGLAPVTASSPAGTAEKRPVSASLRRQSVSLLKNWDAPSE